MADRARTARHSRLLRRYLASYALVVAGPLLGLGALLYNNAVVNLQVEVERTAINSLRTLQRRVEAEFSELDTLVSRIASDSRLTPFALARGPYAQIEAVQELSRYALASALVEEIFLAVPSSDLVYSSVGTISTSAFLNTVYRLEQTSPHEILAELYSAYGRKVLSPDRFTVTTATAEDVLPIAFAIPLGNRNPTGAILAFARTDRLGRLAKEAVSTYSGWVYILGERGEHVARAGAIPDSVPSVDEVLSKPTAIDGVTTIRFGSGTYAVVSVSGTDPAWRYVAVFPQRSFLHGVTRMRFLVVVSIFLLAVISGGLAWALSNSNYRPIQRLIEEAVTHFPDVSPTDADDELEFLGRVLELESQEKRALALQAENIDVLERQRVLADLLRRGGRAPVDSAALSRLVFPYSSYLVLVIQLGDAAGTDIWRRERAMQRLARYHGEGFVAYGLELISEDAIALVVNCSHRKGPGGEPNAIAERLLAVVIELGFPDAVVASSSVSSTVSSVGELLVEALTVLGAKSPYRRSRILRPEPLGMNREQEQKRLPGQLLQLTGQSLRQGNMGLALETVREATNGVFRDVVPSGTERLLALEIVSRILRTADELGVEVPGSLVEELGNFDNVHEFSRLLELVVGDVCSAVHQRTQASTHELYARVREYVDANYANPGISLASVADELKHSVSHISRTFREQQGQTFSDYLSSLRMKEMKRLLVETDLAVKQVVAEIGYSDVANCIRKFRLQEGLTPEAYRRLVRSREMVHDASPSPDQEPES